MHLTKNVAIEELSMKWKVSRFVTKRTHALLHTLITAHRPFILNLIERVASSSRPTKKRRLNSDLATSLDETPKPTRKRPSPFVISADRSRSSEGGPRGTEAVEIIADSEEEDNMQPELVPSSDVEENNSISDRQSLLMALRSILIILVSEDNLIDCPLCHKKVRLRYINAHMDNGCGLHVVSDVASSSKKQRNETKNKWNSVFSSAKVNGVKGNGKGKELGRFVADFNTQHFTVCHDMYTNHLSIGTYQTLLTSPLNDYRNLTTIP